MPLGYYEGKAMVELLDDGRRIQLRSPFAYIDPRGRARVRIGSDFSGVRSEASSQNWIFIQVGCSYGLNALQCDRVEPVRPSRAREDIKSLAPLGRKAAFIYR